MIEIAERDGIAIVTLVHGKANAMDTEFCRAVTDAFVKLQRSPARAVVLTGQGGMFSAGVNLIRARRRRASAELRPRCRHAFARPRSPRSRLC